ncbi:MAG: oligosaccharide flippase family protein [Actinomycetia bacterium]|nr:oligosaccharide flippase family protein [Actinomycetes bacterium]
MSDPENPDPGGITHGANVVRSARAALAGQLVLRVGSFALGVFLARVLGPEPFGVYVVSLSIIMFTLAINDLGTVPALIASRRPLAETAPTALAMVLIVSGVLTGLLLLVSGPLTSAVGLDGQAAPLRALTAVLVLDALATPANAKLRRELRHSELARAEVAGIVCQIAAALALVALDAGVWILVISHLVGNVVASLAMLRASRFLPRPHFDPTVLPELWAFGSRQASSQAVQEGIINLDYVVIGSRLGPGPTGLYQRGFNTASWAVSVAGEVVGRVGVAAFAPVVDEPRRLDEALRRTLVVLTIALAPAAALLAGLAEPLVLLLYGEEWLGAVVIVRILCVLGAMRVLLTVGSDVLTAAHRTGSVLRLNAVWLAVLLPAILVAVEIDGLRGAAVAQVFTALVVAAPVMVMLLRRLGLSGRRAGTELLPIVVVAVSVSPLAWAVSTQFSTVTGLLAGGAVGGAYYILSLGLIARPQLREVISTALGRGR